MQIAYTQRGPNLYRPFAPTWIHGPGGSVLLDGILDTGADRVLLPLRVCQLLGVDWASLSYSTSIQLPSGQQLHCKTINLVLALHDNATVICWHAEVAIPATPIAYPYWGFKGFLEFFRAEFDGPNRVVTLLPGANLPAAPPPP